MFYSEDIGC